MSTGWLTKIAGSDIEVTAYATAVDRIGRRDPGEITYLEDTAAYEYWDGTAWQPLGGGGGGGEQGPPGEQGPKGDQGDTGPAAATGPGVATGGTTGQVLAKNSATNYDTVWTTPASGGGGVTPPVTITGTDPATVPLTVKAAAGQSADLLDVSSSTGARLFSVDGTGSTIVFNQAQGIVGYGGSVRVRPDWTSGYGALLVKGNPAVGTHTQIQAEVGGMPLDLVGPVSVLTDGNAPSFGGGAGPMLFLANDTSDPSTNPVGGGILFVSNGALKYRGSSGTVTTIAPA